MKIYSCFTPSHEILYRDYFLPALPKEFEHHIAPIDISGSGDFGTTDFIQCLEAKLEMALESIVDNAGSAIVWSDVDIIFTRKSVPLFNDLLKDRDTDIWFQKERPGGDKEVNAGLILMRCNEAVERLYRDAIALMRSTPGYNDQHAINDILSKGADISWAYLPHQFAARSHGWPPRRDFVAYHANCTMGDNGVGQKIRQFGKVRKLQRWGPVYWHYVRNRDKLRRSFHKRRNGR